MVCKPINSQPSSSQARQAALSFGPRKTTPPTIKIRDSADSNGPRTKFALPAADPSHLSSQVPRADSRCRSSARCPASCLVYNSPHVRQRNDTPGPDRTYQPSWRRCGTHKAEGQGYLHKPRHLLLASNEVYSASCRHTRKWYPLPRDLL